MAVITTKNAMAVKFDNEGMVKMAMAINIISVGLLAVFLFAYYMKLWLLKRNFGIRGEVFAKGQKSLKTALIEIILKIASFTAFIVWALSAVFVQRSVPGFEPMFICTVLSCIGLFLSGCGVLMFILAMVQMRNSWRAGIDKENKTELITAGIYKYIKLYTWLHNITGLKLIYHSNHFRSVFCLTRYLPEE